MVTQEEYDAARAVRKEISQAIGDDNSRWTDDCHLDPRWDEAGSVLKQWNDEHPTEVAAFWAWDAEMLAETDRWLECFRRQHEQRERDAAEQTARWSAHIEATMDGFHKSMEELRAKWRSEDAGIPPAPATAPAPDRRTKAQLLQEIELLRAEIEQLKVDASRLPE